MINKKAFFILLSSMILIAFSGCATQKSLRETSRPDWIKNKPGVLAPDELVSPENQ